MPELDPGLLGCFCWDLSDIPVSPFEELASEPLWLGIGDFFMVPVSPCEVPVSAPERLCPLCIDPLLGPDEVPLSPPLELSVPDFFPITGITLTASE